MLIQGREEGIKPTSSYFLPRQHGNRLLISSLPNSPVLLHNLDTGESEKLGVRGYGAIYSPSGHVLTIRIRGGEGVTRGIWAWPVSTDTLKPRGEAFLVAEDGWVPSLTADGTLVYLVGPGRAHQLVWRDRSGKKVGLIGQRQPGIFFPELSPDGRRVATGAFDLGVNDIWLHDVERPVKTRFTFDEHWDTCPVWSPAGDRITFITVVEGEVRLLSKPADLSGEATLLPTLGRGAFPIQWSADEKYLLFTRRPGGQGDIWYRKRKDDNSGYEDVPFLKEPFQEFTPQFSPDGRFVSYSSNESGQHEVYVRRFPDGSAKQQVSLNGGTQPRWSHNGKELFYVEGDWLVVIPVSTSPSFSMGSARRLFRAAAISAAGVMPTYDVSPDGERFVIAEPVEDAPLPSIRVVQNWAAEFKDREE